MTQEELIAEVQNIVGNTAKELTKQNYAIACERINASRLSPADKMGVIQQLDATFTLGLLFEIKTMLKEKMQ